MTLRLILTWSTLIILIFIKQLRLALLLLWNLISKILLWRKEIFNWLKLIKSRKLSSRKIKIDKIVRNLVIIIAILVVLILIVKSRNEIVKTIIKIFLISLISSLCYVNRTSMFSIQSSLNFLLNVYFYYEKIHICNDIKNVEISSKFKIKIIVTKKNLNIHKHFRLSRRSNNNLSVFNKFTTTTNIVHSISLSCYDNKSDKQRFLSSFK